MNEIELCLTEIQDFFQTGTTLAVAWRKKQLKRLKEAIRLYEKRILDALAEDLGKSGFEAYATELLIVNEEIDEYLKHLDEYSRKVPVRGNLFSFPSKAYTVAQPLGVVLIMSPWNYPFQLSMAPLVSAMAAGNCAIVKPSRYSSHTSQIIDELINKTFPSQYIAVFQGPSEVNQQLLEHRYDHIFFTGSQHVGRIVMESAARNLTPVTLELGGKSPVIVDKTANLKLAARRIIWGKCINAGQTCVAPDYVLVDKSVSQALIDQMKKAISQMFGSDPLHSPDLAHIINEKHFSRLISLFTCGTLAYGGQIDPKKLRIAPTIIVNPDLESDLMQDEIFGPILPIVAYESFDQAISFIQKRPHPLALYIFSKNKQNQMQAVSTVRYGGGCINDVVMHLTNTRLPFGGFGESGMGAYHGKKGFDTFSHTKSILESKTWLDIKIRYAPYKKKLSLIKRLFS